MEATTSSNLSRIDDEKEIQSLPRVVCVIGSTGTGKTKLGVELAKAFNGEIVNADCLQVYKGLEIATAKASHEEMDGVPHHLLGVIDTDQEQLTSHHFVSMAVPIISDIISRGRLPIIVGGTLNYVHELLWKNQIEQQQQDVQTNEKAKRVKTDCPPSSESIDTNVSSWQRLSELDPKTASKLHPRDHRKIARALQILESTGQSRSELIESKSIQSRFHSLNIWIDCDSDILKDRLNSRTQKMIQNGILAELMDLYVHLQENTKNELSCIDSEKGIQQAIGFKEFEPFLKVRYGDSSTTDTNKNDNINNNPKTKASKHSLADHSQAIVSEESQHSVVAFSPRNKNEESLLESCRSVLLTRTLRYATKQKRFIRNRFLAKVVQTFPEHFIVKVDSSQVSHWHENVFIPSSNAMKDFLHGTVADLKRSCQAVIASQNDTKNESDMPPIDPSIASKVSVEVDGWCQVKCHLCEKILNGPIEWKAHLKSRRHRANVRKSKKGTMPPKGQSPKT